MDDSEEATNRNRSSVPRDHLVLYQFSARGHEMAQCILASHVDHPHDAVSAYYRSRPTLLSLGLSIEDGFAYAAEKVAGLFASAEAAEGMSAFAAKRKPKWAEEKT